MVSSLINLVELSQAKPAISEPEPEWIGDMMAGLRDAFEEAIEASHENPPPVPSPTFPPEVLATLQELFQRLDLLISTQQIPIISPSDVDKVLIRLAELPGSLEAGFERLNNRLSEQLAAATRRPPPAPVTKAGNGVGNGPTKPPNPRVLPPQPLANGGSLPLTPQIPAPYVPGNVYVPAGVPTSLMSLIQTWLSPNCPGSAVEFQISADASNADSIFVGGASILGGPLSATNYAYELTSTSPPRLYRSTYPGGSGAIGEIQVFSASASVLHVEVLT
jgi:hypothetical protein